ncbi:MAG: dUTP diphosphatase [Salinivirgaceae bacterium]|jgi:dUTP pyrophosphatase|nr:dUTP diphosphatase [Salinivirgaceae bacterium]
MKLKVINISPYPLTYATDNSAGLDLHANLQDHISINPLQRVLIPTGLHIELPVGYEAMVRPRSGLALKHGITVLNTPGTIDADYRGEIGVILVNLGKEDYTVKPGDRIAQMVINKYEHVTVEVVDKLTETTRGEGGFGHSGK